MVDQSVPPADFPPTPRPPFTSPYGMFPDVDAARDELAAELAARGNVIDPLAVPFDPAKPTIDQTRSNAIDSIRNNFAALNTASTIDPTLYLKKSGDVATDLTVTHPTATSPLTLNPIAGQQGTITWKQAGATKFAHVTSGDTTTHTLVATPDTGGPFNVFSARRADGMSMFSGGVAIGGGNFPRTTQGAPIALDVYKAGQTSVALFQAADGSAIRLQAASGNTYIDSLLCGTGATAADPAVGVRALTVRVQDSTGALQNRLTFDPGGGILAGVAAFAGPYAWMGGPSTMALDFRTMQTAGLQPGSVISGATMLTGQVARIMVNGGGAITLPAAWHIQQGGAVWGTAYTIVSLVCIDGPSSFIFATFTPFQS